MAIWAGWSPIPGSGVTPRPARHTKGAMRARPQAWAGPAREAIAAFLAAVLFLHVALSGGGALRAAGPAFDPLSALCSVHADPAALPIQGGGDAPDPQHALCCVVACGFGCGLASTLPPDADQVPAPLRQAASAVERRADPPPCPARLRGGHRARAPPAVA